MFITFVYNSMSCQLMRNSTNPDTKPTHRPLAGPTKKPLCAYMFVESAPLRTGVPVHENGPDVGLLVGPRPSQVHFDVPKPSACQSLSQTLVTSKIILIGYQTSDIVWYDFGTHVFQNKTRLQHQVEPIYPFISIQMYSENISTGNRCPINVIFEVIDVINEH